MGGDGADDDLGIDQPCGADDLFDHLSGVFFFVFGGGGGNEDGLRHDFFKFVEFERAVVAGGRQAEAVVDEVLLARCVAFVHAADLGDGNVAFVNEHDGVVGQVVHQRGRRFAFFFAREVAGVVFDAFAEAHFVEHFEVEAGALFDALLLDRTLFAGEKFDAFAQFFFDGLAGAQYGVARGNVVAGWEDGVASDALNKAA